MISIFDDSSTSHRFVTYDSNVQLLSNTEAEYETITNIGDDRPRVQICEHEKARLNMNQENKWQLSSYEVTIDADMFIRGSVAFLLGLFVALLTGCATQAPYTSPALAVPRTWSADAATLPSRAGQPRWWRALNDPEINAFVESTLDDNPTIAQVVARLDEARAHLGVNSASRLPSVSANAGASHGNVLDTSGISASGVTNTTAASIGPTISWELDLFGRVRQSVEAASRRLDARTADADAVRISLAADVVSNVLSLRACDRTLGILAEDIRSREVALELVRQRVAVGASAPVDEARSRSGLASARTSLVAHEEQCTRTVNALVSLSGLDAASVRNLIPAQLPSTDPRTTALAPQPITAVPKATPKLPARVLLRHPAVRAAENEAAAAWADIGVARADRLPRIDLAAVLSGGWLRAAGTTLRYTAWSLGYSASGKLFDGGAGAANVDAAEARYRAAVAILRQAVRTAAQDVENALAARQSAEARAALTTESVDAARQTFAATYDQWRAGAVSLFELEDARRQLTSALDSSIAADRDRAQAWVALVRSSGNAITNPEEVTP